jgi:peptidoglycan/xylan/chitin deacetylase (PgdA/CDA1 family)
MNIPILLYHSISNEATSLYKSWAISPLEFDRHLDFLNKQGYQPITIKNVVDAIRCGGKGLPDRPLVITFDDGMADFLSGAMPILKKYNFPATLYIVTGYVGETSRWLMDEQEYNRPMLTWNQLAALEGIEIGSHSHSHFHMDLLPLAQARTEIMHSKMLLEQHLGRSIDTFAFPHGYHTKKLLKVVEESGYSSACIVRHGMANDSSNVYALPRIIITSDVTMATLDQFLQGKRLTRVSAWRSFLRKAWRMVRWIKLGRINFQHSAIDADAKSQENLS